MDPARDDTGVLTAPPFVWKPPVRKYRDRVWLHVALFVLTLYTTTNAGAIFYLEFLADFHPIRIVLPSMALLVRGLWYSGTILAILGCHELGHYVACRYYDVDATLPFFLPMPLLFTGTLGAFIRIREPIPSKRMFFDIGIAGPIAGFLVAVPALFIGLSMSRVLPLPPQFVGVELGEPLLFRLASALIWGSPPAGYSINLHPVGFAAWFGLLATAINLVPIGQLDGGHISYAVFGRKSTYVTYAMLGAAVVLAYFYTTSWIVWTIVMIAMLFAFGLRHPHTVDEDVPLDHARVGLAIVALIIFILCFTPAPIQPTQLLRR